MTVLTVYFSIIDNDETADESPQAKSGHHPHFDRAVMRSRRKSVSFAVYKVNADTMQFDIEHKSVLLGNLSGRVRLAFDSSSLGAKYISFVDIIVNFIIQKLKSKHLVCLSFLW